MSDWCRAGRSSRVAGYSERQAEAVKFREGTPARSFFGAVGAWLIALILITQVFGLVTTPYLWSRSSLWSWLAMPVSNAGLFLPFVVFVGGLAVHHRERARWVFGRALAVSLLSSQSLLDHPPNRITYLLHTRFTIPLVGIPVALIGLLFGTLTSGLSPPARRNTRWAFGLANSVLLFIPFWWTGRWTITDTSSPGLFAAWLLLALPLAELLLFWFIARSRMERLHTSGRLNV